MFTWCVCVCVRARARARACSGKWTVQQAAELTVAAPTITASLDGRYMSACKDERVAAAKFYEKLGLKVTACRG
jgi:6-phosphogluconate dehydrogenase